MDAGIYVIENLANGKLYIGSTVSMRRRLALHKSDLRRGRHASQHLQRAWAKYGESMFEFGCLEVVECTTRLVEREQAWIDALRACDRGKGYNVRITAGSGLGLRHTAETRVKMSLARRNQKIAPLSDAHKVKLSLAQKGEVLSEEHKARIGAAHRGRRLSAEHRAKLRGRKRSAESIERMRLAQRGKVLSDEHKAKVSLAGMGRRPTAETTAKLLLAAKKRVRDATTGRFRR